MIIKGRKVPVSTDAKPALDTPTDPPNPAPVPAAPLLTKLPRICMIFGHKPQAFVDLLHLIKLTTSINKQFL